MTKQKTLSPVMKEAMKKLTYEWQSASALGVSRNTLDALVSRGMVDCKRSLGYMFLPRTHIDYRFARE